MALERVKSSLAYLHETLNQVEGLPEQQILTLEETLADERDILINLGDEHRLPLQLKSIDCKNITVEDYEHINLAMQ